MNISIENRKIFRMRSLPQTVEQLKADGITDEKNRITAYRLRIWAKQGVIPSVQCGKKVLINYDALLDFLSGEVKA